MTREPIGDRKRFDRLPGGGYAYTLIDDCLRIEVRYLRRESRLLHAEVDVQCDWAGVTHHNGSLSCADLNLSSQTARKTLAKYCAEQAKTKAGEFDWMAPINAACLETIRAEREGDVLIELDDAPALQDRDFNIHGLKIPADATSLLIAHGDSLKSLITLLALGTLVQQGHKVLYMDWEWTADRHKARKMRLFGPERLEGLYYVRCQAPLVVEADRMRRFCDMNGVTFVAIDSVGLACDGKLVDDDVAIRFHRALRTLPPSLCAAHVAKSSLGPDAKVEPQAFGSVYFSNLCRASWVVKKETGVTDDIVNVGLFPQKQNDGGRRKPVGLEFTFNPDRIGVRSVDLAAVDGLADKLPLAVRMIHLLRRGPMTYADIASELDAKVDSVMKVAARGTHNSGSSPFTKVPGQDGITRLALVARPMAVK